MSKETKEELHVTEIDKKERIDLYLAKKLKGVSRSKITSALKAGEILLNGSTTPQKTFVQTGDTIQILVDLESRGKIELKESPLPLSVLYEDKDLIVVNKQAGISTHPSLSDHGTGNTLLEAILTHCKKENLWEEERKTSERPGVVHRLDKDTTGTLVWAKNEKTLKELQKQFKEKTNKREYLVLLVGDMLEEAITCESYLIRDPQNKTRFTSTKEESSGGKWAKSFFKREATYGDKYTLAKVTLHTGRTHQIRVHAKELGLPVLGDPLYSLKNTLSQVFKESTRKALGNISRQMLHAKILGFTHPTSGEKLSFEASEPQDFQEILKQLSSY